MLSVQRLRERIGEHMSYKTPEETAQARAAWELAVSLLVNSGMTEPTARQAFGKLLSRYKLAAEAMLPALETCKAIGTMDAYPWLTKAAQRASERASKPDPSLQCDWS